MCGLYGAFTTNTFNNEDVNRLYELGTLSTLRGVDSSGMLIGRKQKKHFNFTSRHSLSTAVDLFTTEGAYNALKGSNAALVLGHCRAATVGKITLDNAHPIKEGAIIGCHNGTVHRFAPGSKEDDTKNSDSREFFKRINNDGIQKTIDNAGISAAYALTWVDINKGTLHFLRNKERTLFYIVSKDGTKIFWASEHRFLRFVFPTYLPDYNNIEFLPIDELMSFDLRAGVSSKRTEKMEPILHVFKSHVSVYDTEEGWSLWDEDKDQVKQQLALPPEEKKKEQVSITTGLPAYYRAYAGVYRTTPVMQKLIASKGCMWCGRKDLKVTDDLTWVDEEEYLCKKCVVDDTVLAYTDNLEMYKGRLSTSLD